MASVGDINAQRWEQAFAALCRYRGQEGHCCPPQNYMAGKYKLGRWVITQRYLNGHLSVERKRRLDGIGFVWSWRDFAWERGFAALLQFKRRAGHCRVPIQHWEGKYNLGSWVSVQRRNKNLMAPKRKARLNKIGFEWQVYKKYGAGSGKRR